MADPSPLPPGSTIGILGGGQLGRMLALAAAPLGLRCHVFCPGEDAPAFDVCFARTRARYDDEAALAAFARGCDAVTYEFENIPSASLDVIENAVPVRPGRRSLEVSADRLIEKAFVSSLGIAVAPHAAVDDPDGLEEAIELLGLPAILKTRRLGYDGHGQIAIARAEDASAALESLGGAPSILEAVVAFEREVSVVAARGLDGAFAAHDVTENRHEGGILRTSQVPAELDASLAERAIDAARRIAEALDHVGVLAVEFFVAAGGELIVNEIAPRVHNSGHWTIDTGTTSQFENHMRAVAGWPLGDGSRRADARMENLLGPDAERWNEIASEPGARLHLYGKRDARPGRKMGHVTRVLGRP